MLSLGKGGADLAGILALREDADMAAAECFARAGAAIPEAPLEADWIAVSVLDLPLCLCNKTDYLTFKIELFRIRLAPVSLHRPVGLEGSSAGLAAWSSTSPLSIVS
jgi:hypothetical protein